MTLTEAIAVLENEILEGIYFTVGVEFTRYSTRAEGSIEFSAYCETRTHYKGHTLEIAVGQLVTALRNPNWTESPQEEAEEIFAEAETAP